VKELPHYTQSTRAVRIWQARPNDARSCTYWDRLSGDDPMQSHAPINPDDMWWIAGPIATPRRPDEAPRPDFGDVVCGPHLEQAIYTKWTGWQEADMELSAAGEYILPEEQPGG
jgi:hypothetical protein